MKTSTSKPSAASLAKQIASPTFKRAWEKALESLARAQARETRDWDALYETLGSILDHDPPLYLAGGFKTAREFLAKRFSDEDERTVRTKVKVARYFTPEDEAKFRLSRLELLVEYKTALAKGKLPPAAKIDPARERVRIPYGTGGSTRLAPFAKCNVQLLRAAVRIAKTGHVSEPVDEAAPVLKLRAHLARHELSAVSVSLRGTKLTLAGIEVNRVAALGKALATLRSK